MKNMLAAAMLIAAPTAAFALDYQDAYLQCVEKSAVTLGKDNSEPAETVLRAAYFECDFVYSMALMETPESKGRSEASLSTDRAEREGAHLRQIAGDRAIAALLKARLNRAARLSSATAQHP